MSISIRLASFRLCFSVLLLTVFSAPGFSAPAAGLTVTAGEGTVLDGPQSAHFDFGTRLESDTAPLVHVFMLRNEAASPLTIRRLQSSCGCTTAAAGGALPLTVAPGRTVPIRVQISPRRLLPGETHKSVWVYTQGAGDAVLQLEMRGVVHTDESCAALPAAFAPAAGDLAPALTVIDTEGRAFTLAATHGHPVALLFFCGCPWCAEAARLWGHLQRSGALPPDTQTVVIFDGDAAAVRAFASANKLDLSRTTLLPDPDNRLTEDVYKVTSCPRVFALDPAGMILYTNSHADDQPRVAPAKTLTRRMQTALKNRQ